MKKTLAVSRCAFVFAFALVILLIAQPSFASSPSPYSQDSLQFFKKYFVNGDYVVSGVGLRGLGVNGLAKGNITVSGIPNDAVVVAAFLYWETIEGTVQPSSMNGFFQGYPIVGVSRGTGSSPCWSGGGGTGGSNGSKTLRVYRADVAPYLIVNGQYTTNTPAGTPGYEVKLPDSGSNGAGVPLTEGASLVIVYRDLHDPLRAVLFYDGSWTMNNATPFMSQTLDWFYQSAQSSQAHLTHIVGDGQQNFGETISFANGIDQPVVLNGGTNPQPGFTGSLGGSWDNPYYTVSTPDGSVVPAALDRQSPMATYVSPDASSFDCLSWGAVIFSTPVIDTDRDGLLDVWEQRHGYFDQLPSADPTLPPPAPTWVSLYTDPNVEPQPELTPDLYVQVDWLSNVGTTVIKPHSHLPKLTALDTVGGAFKKHGVFVHFDVGQTAYQGLNPPDPYVIPAASALPRPVAEWDEADVACTDATGALCDYPSNPAIPGIVSWKTGVIRAKNQFFPHGRSYSYHYLFSGHAIGFPATTWSVPDGTVSTIVVSGGIATVNTTVAHGLSNGARVSISGVVGDLNLNGAFDISNPTTNSFTFNAPNVAPGTYGVISQPLPFINNGTTVSSQEPNLAISSGAPVSISGFSDLGGGDSLITLGLWKSDDGACQPYPNLALDANHPVYCNDMVGTTTVQAGTIMHEIGHTLYLTHGGFYDGEGFGQNCKSNFQSVMNYMFQIRGIPNQDGSATPANVDYSAQVLPTLSEAQLDETVGLSYYTPSASGSLPQPPTYGTRYYGPANYLTKLAQKVQNAGSPYASQHCDGTPRLDTELAVRVDAATVGYDLQNKPFSAPINWDNQLPVTYGTVLDQDINFDGTNNDTELGGFSDWDHLYFQQIDSRRNGSAFSADVSVNEIGSGGKLIGGGGKLIGGGSDLLNAGSQLLGSGGKLIGGGGKLIGGGLKLIGGGLELDFDIANSIVDPPTILASSVQTGKTTVTINWNPPSFGQIRTYYIWRAVTTKYPMSPTNPPILIATRTATLGMNSYPDNTVKSNQTYRYFVVAALGSNIGVNSGNQSGPSNFFDVAVK